MTLFILLGRAFRRKMACSLSKNPLGLWGPQPPGSLVRLRRHICRNDKRFADPVFIPQLKNPSGIVKGRSP